MKKPYIAKVEGNDQGRRYVLTNPTAAPDGNYTFDPPDDWDAAGVAEEGKSGTKAIGMVITAVIVAAAVLAVFA